jgi:hypothetical protein
VFFFFISDDGFGSCILMQVLYLYSPMCTPTLIKFKCLTQRFIELVSNKKSKTHLVNKN